MGIDSGSRDVKGQAGGEPRVASDVHGLHAHLVDASADHLADLSGVHACPVEQGLLHVAEAADRVASGQFAIATPDRASHGIDNDYFSFDHGSEVR